MEYKNHISMTSFKVVILSIVLMHISVSFAQDAENTDPVTNKIAPKYSNEYLQRLLNLIKR